MNVFRKEIRQMLVAPFAWAVATSFLIVSGIFFVALLIGRPIPDLERYFSNIETTFIVVLPIISMRAFAEERRTGVLETTLAWPASRWSVVLGKYAANTLFAWVIASITWLYAWILDRMGPLQMAKTASGFIGVLALIAMFSALALAVSARSSSPASAAFTGFGVLLGLWILDFIPGWLGGRFGWIVQFFAPTTHLQNSGRGLLDAGDFLYFGAGTLLGLVLTLLALPQAQYPGWRRILSKTRVIPALGLVAVVLLGVFSVHANGQLDLTPERRFTLTDQTVRVLETVEQPIRFTGIVQLGSPQQIEIQSLVRMYKNENSRVTLDFVDPDGQPALTRRLGAITYGQVVVQIGENQEITNDIDEVSITSAIQRTARIRPPLACFTVGHGERSITDSTGAGYSRLALELRQSGYDTVTLALSASGGNERLKKCQVVVLGGPRALLDSSELAALQELAKYQGRLLVISDPSAPVDVTDQLNQLISPWGIVIAKNSVTDRSSLINDSGSIIAFRYPSQSPVTSGLSAQHIPLLMVNSGRLESVILDESAAEQAWLVPLVESSSRSRDNDGRKGPFVLAALTDWSRVTSTTVGVQIARTRIGVVASSEMVANQFGDRFGNMTFAQSLVAWVGAENDIIAAARDPQGVVKLAITQDDRGRLIREAVVFPALIGFAVFGVMLVRLRRG